MPTVIESDWRHRLPLFETRRVTIRQLRTSDAPMLLAMLTTEEVSRFISPPPTTVEGFERFIAWTHRQQEAGKYACFAIVPAGMDDAVGIIQVRAVDPSFTIAEWGFAIGSPYWGTGVFVTAARLALDFVFQHTPVERLEARACTVNGRGNGVLAKLGAVREALLRGSFNRDGTFIDQHLWSILRRDWGMMHDQQVGVVH